MSDAVSSPSSSPAITADELADKRIMRQLTICILGMMGIAVVIVTVARAIA